MVLVELFGADVEVVSTALGELSEIAAAAVGFDAVALDCVRGVAATDVCEATGLAVLRPVHLEVQNRHGFRETRFSHYDRFEPLRSDRHLTPTG